MLGSAALLLAPSLASPSWAGAFRKSESLQGITFVVTSTGEGSQQELTITASGGKKPFAPIRRTVDGRVMGAEVADLNSNGQPEIYVFVQGAGSGSYGELVAYAVTNGTLLPISLQELSGPMAQGYMGHDAFAVVENCLVRRFPIYKANDANAKATGGTREIVYKLVNAKDGWLFQPIRSTDLPPS